MKKLLLLLAGCLFAGSAAFAQDETETPTVTPGWTVRLNVTEPANVASDNTYAMTKTDVQIGGQDVYSYTVTVNVDPSKSSKYYIYVSYTNEEGVVTSKNTNALYQTYADGPIDITVGALLDSKGEIQYILSNSKYLICDTNWTGIGYFDASNTGLTNEVYFNNTKQKGYVAVRNLGTATTEYIPGGNTQYQSNLNVVNKPESQQNGLFKAAFDYSNMTLSFDKVNSLTLDIEDFIPFVSASEATLPNGLTAYVYSSYEDGVMTMEALEGNVVPANTPVLLKGENGSYTIALSDDYTYVFEYDEGTSTRNYLIDSNSEGSLLYGVHQPHLVPTNGYIYSNGSFTKASASDIITALNCYIKLPEAEEYPDDITIEFPKETSYYLVGSMYTDYSEIWEPNPSYKFQAGENNTYTLTVGSVTTDDKFMVAEVYEGEVTKYFGRESTNLVNTIENNQTVQLYSFEGAADGNAYSIANTELVNVTFTFNSGNNKLTVSGETTGNTWIISPGNDQTMQSGTITDSENSDAEGHISMVSTSNGALIFVYAPAGVETIYYYLTNTPYSSEEENGDDNGEEIEEETEGTLLRAVTLPENAVYKTATVGEEGYATIGLPGGSGNLYLATSNEGDNLVMYTYTVIPGGTPTAVEAVEAASEEGPIYNVFGQRVDENYKGIVIRNGKKFLQR